MLKLNLFENLSILKNVITEKAFQFKGCAEFALNCETLCDTNATQSNVNKKIIKRNLGNFQVSMKSFQMIGKASSRE